MFADEEKASCTAKFNESLYSAADKQTFSKERGVNVERDNYRMFLYCLLTIGRHIKNTTIN